MISDRGIEYNMNWCDSYYINQYPAKVWAVDPPAYRLRCGQNGPGSVILFII